MLYFGVGGMILTLIGISAGLYSFYEYTSSSFLPFLPSLVAVLLFFLGMISMFSGIILASLAVHKN
jgi:hypothetical protein